MEYARTFPAYRFRGSHREIGRQFGEATRELTRQHRDLAVARLGANSGVGAEDALAAALRYRPFVQEYAPFLDEEIVGVAEGAGLTLAEAYLLQLRAELANTAGLYDEIGDECTTFAVLAEQTTNGSPLIGQNADLPAFYKGIGVVIEITSDDGLPPVLMLTPAGQVSYIGINGEGLGVFANFLTCDGWRLGFPRYLLSRLALTHRTVDAAIAAIDGVPRASSRNMLLLDTQGGAADLETTPTRSARLRPGLGFIAHANHYVAPSLLGEERYAEGPRENSCTREGRMIELLALHRGNLDAARMQELLRDRATAPDTLSRAPEDDPTRDVITFASVIAEPALGQMWVAVGPPHQHAYQRYAFSA
ncbi:MAG: C45 family autoproteolytic acyltransferase/hydrolase [Thermomicrobiales bacterium]